MTRSNRPVPLGLTFLVSLSAAVVALSLSGGRAQAHGDEYATPAAQTSPAADLELAMQQLWHEHVTWTRLAIVSFTSGLPDLEPTLDRLLRNQRELGDAIKPY